jgi:hypothetical protein
MMLVVDTQYCENYGAHDWDGKGACPQYWKFKGGSSYKVVNVPEGIDLEEVVELVRGEIEHKSDYAEEYIVGWTQKPSDWMSDFERSQLEYDGSIQFPEPTIDYAELNAGYTDPAEYAETAADLDAVYYGA